MRERQASIADHLVEARALLDGRYRLDGVVRRSATSTIHVATHRNGSTAWLKLPFSAAHGEQLALEARIANTIGSPLLVRDDGTTPDGVPYLVLEPPDAASVAALRARAKTGERLALARVMTAGDALARVVASIHAIGHVTAGLADEDVLVFANGDVALLDLHALSPLSAAGVAADVTRVRAVLSSLLADVAEPAPSPSAAAALGSVLAAAYADVPALQAAWRAASPVPIEAPSRARPGSLADVPSSGSFPGHETPIALSLPKKPTPETESSMIGYLRSGHVPSLRPDAPREQAVMYDPLSKVAELPRLVQAASHVAEPRARTAKRGAWAGAVFVAGIATLVAAAAILVWLSGSDPKPEPARSVAVEQPPPAITQVHVVPPAVAVEAPAPAPVAPVAPVAPAAAVAPAADELETTAMLSTAGAPPDRDVFVDGLSVGKTPLATSVPCGPHTLQMVAGAPKQPVDLPCGGQRVITYDANGRWTVK
jgi:hypothetical protein